jgi:hypothetical protein
MICHAHNYENLKVKAILSIVERNWEFIFKLLSLNVLREVLILLECTFTHLINLRTNVLLNFFKA